MHVDDSAEKREEGGGEPTPPPPPLAELPDRNWIHVGCDSRASSSLEAACERFLSCGSERRLATSEL
eukprot:3878207-Pyramimonas_sp.AAC.1